MTREMKLVQVEQQEDAVKEMPPPDTVEEDEVRPAKKMKAMDLFFGNTFQKMPETCLGSGSE
ncbi:hypothetical protein IRJ41_002901, partial [Triplophysa rosa]